MTSINDDWDSYISVDIETAGAIPGMFAMLSIGACTLGEPRQTFYVELQPDQTRYDPQAMAIHNLDPDILLKDGVPAAMALNLFSDWLTTVVPAGNQPLFVAFNAPFDWSFINDYFIRYLGNNPFGHSAIDIKAVYMGLSGKAWRETSGEHLHRLFNKSRTISHNALEDAVDQAVIFEGILSELKSAPTPV